MRESISGTHPVAGKFVTVEDERYYMISNIDNMAPFFISLVSDSDHWLFISSNGGLTAGRVSPETALFPYINVDKIYESTPHTGSKTLLRVDEDGRRSDWEPFNKEQDGHYEVTRNLYKNILGNKLLFEEINHDLQLVFRYSWLSSENYGFVRHCELENLGSKPCEVEILDGLQNILPAGTPRLSQTNTSYLVDAYKWSELDEETGLALFTLFTAISDRAEPCESLKATTVFCLGLSGHRVLLSSEQVDDFRHGSAVVQETHKRGIRGAYMVNASLLLPAETCRNWQMIANLEQSQTESALLQHQLRDPEAVSTAIAASVAAGSDALTRIMAAADGFQLTAEEEVSAHHYANVLFNILRGGIFDNQYIISSAHFCGHIKRFNQEVYARHRSFLDALPAQVDCTQLRRSIEECDDTQLERLVYEYLPITFGRRHGDPSRPWNQFAIKLKDDHGNRLLSYQGNWRDIFQNWETLLFSYPEFIENVIARFVNASTVDGYNPYRVTNEGIDWEVEDPEDPWSYIGYWGDHQIIYLQKLLELSLKFHPERLGELLHRPIFSYANVPYKIKPFDALLQDAKSTVVFDSAQAGEIEQRVAELGADGKLVHTANNQVYQVNLLEKLLVPLLSKLGNLVAGGGIWLNTQRPEWNDANNALVGQGLSMVTLYYLRRYIGFLQELLSNEASTVNLSREVGKWMSETAAPLALLRKDTGDTPLDAARRYQTLAELGQAASRYRQAVYEQEYFGGVESLELAPIAAMLDDAMAVIDHSIQENLRDDGLYHAYNLLKIEHEAAEIDTLYPMLEGQVAALSSGAVAPGDAAALLETLFDSDLFRTDQNSFLLYPDRSLPRFLQKNCVPADRVEALPLITKMLQQGDTRIMERDVNDNYRFNGDLRNVGDLNARLESLGPDYDEAVESVRAQLQSLYEEVFDHKSFTGRSGGMFGFEGLGSIYWHMVSKLLLAVQENFFTAREQRADDAVCQRLGDLYYRVREGIGFNKSPAEYGAFPMDPYSHTPKHLGAQQPGMTGQVKEEVLTRFGELGLRVDAGAVRFETSLLRAREFSAAAGTFRFLDVNGQWSEIPVPEAGLAFTWCQVPLIYRLDDTTDAALSIEWDDGNRDTLASLSLPSNIASQLFTRNGRIRKLELVLGSHMLFKE